MFQVIGIKNSIPYSIMGESTHWYLKHVLNIENELDSSVFIDEETALYCKQKMLHDDYIVSCENNRYVFVKRFNFTIGYNTGDISKKYNRCRLVICTLSARIVTMYPF